MKKTVLNVNIAEFLAEFFMNRIGEKVQFLYSLFWDAFHEDYGTPELMDWMKTAIFIMSMKLICSWLEMWKETTFVTQSTRGRGSGSIQAS